MMDKLIAKAVKRAVDIRENSYDKVASDIATATSKEAEEAYRAAHPNGLFMGYPDYNRFYTKSLQDACDEAAKEIGHKNLGRLIYLALDGWWNDTIEWADSILGTDLIKYIKTVSTGAPQLECGCGTVDILHKPVYAEDSAYLFSQRGWSCNDGTVICKSCKAKLESEHA